MEYVYRLTSQFPNYSQYDILTRTIWQWNLKLIQFISTLSPHTKATLKSIWETIQHYNILTHLESLILYSYKKLVDFYPTVMRFGTKPVQDWKEPNRFLLKTIANSTLFFFPTEMDLDQIIDSKTVFVGNQQSFGLQTLILQCKIYNQTNIWPRSCLDSFGFKVPIIKHFMEYLGSVELDHLDKVIRSNQPVIVYPGGWREQLKKSSVEKYKLDFEHQKLIELVTLVKENGNRVLPLGAIGIDDMLNIIIDIPMPFETSFPVTIITSYQKQYITIGTEITRWDDQIPYVPLLKSCFETIQESRSRQERDVFRYPMQPFWNVLETVKNRVERRFGGDEMVGSSGKKLSGWLKHKVSTRFNQVLDSGRRVTIEEMEE